MEHDLGKILRGNLDTGPRKVGADAMGNEGGEFSGERTIAAAEIKHRAEAEPMLRHRLAQQCWRRIRQIGEGTVETRRVLVEQRAHVAVQRLSRRIGAAEPREPQCGPVAEWNRKDPIAREVVSPPPSGRSDLDPERRGPVAG